MHKIYKYEVAIVEDFHVALPEGARILSVQVQNGKPFFWALVDQDARLRVAEFVIIGTGWPIADDKIEQRTFIGTFQMPGGFVWHLFQRK